ncbi:MAG: RNA-binding cell elongation regulator Jag/EloR [Chloroflexota bacterium]
MESIEVTGKTVDEAIAAASAKLGIPPDRLDYTIVTEGSKGILGIGAEDARITVSPHPALAPGETLPVGGYRAASASGAEPAAAAYEWTSSTASTSEPSPAARPGRPRAHVEGGTTTALQTLEELLDRMDVDGQVTVRAEDPITLNVTGKELGILIGRRGETLTALQFVLNQILNQQIGEWLGVVVDVEDYRLRREDSLRGLAKRMADRARYYRQAVTLEPMPPHERRIVHLALQEHPQVSTHSIGEGEDRRVVITPKDL